MKDMELLNVTVVVDDSTGMLDYGVTGFCKEWLARDKARREKLADFFLDLFQRCLLSKPPFGENYEQRQDAGQSDHLLASAEI